MKHDSWKAWKNETHNTIKEVDEFQFDEASDDNGDEEF